MRRCHDKMILDNMCTRIEDSGLTHDVEFDGVAGGVALDVGGHAGVVAGAAPPHPLQHEAPARQDHAPCVVGTNHHVL